MNFLEATRTVGSFEGGEPLPFLLAMSGTADPLHLFVRAAAARCGRTAAMRTLPFNTLAQALLAEPEPGEREILLLLPWDFVPAADWRSGVPPNRPDADELRRAAGRTASLLASRRAAALIYVPAPFPPLCSPADDASLGHWLLSLACSLKARVLPPDVFSLGMYLASGCPFGGAQLGTVAESVVEFALAEPTPSRRVLVTDLDNVLWGGTIAEDGIDGIAFAPEGAGFRHFIFQTLLAKLKREGAILCAVSRNDLEVALEPLRSGRMVLGAGDFVAILAGYQPKSVHIQQLADELNLGLDGFVFVDDNSVELAEVSSSLPPVRCLTFPTKDEMIVPLCSELARLFANPMVTAEDRGRTELYRRRLSSMPPRPAAETDLTGFLRSLDMKLTIHDRRRGDRTRVVQLINKTNQFNLNGLRVTEEEIEDVLAAGGRLYGATLEDRHGLHGEILACLISTDGTIQSFVVSCRVLQRRVEHAFLAWLAAEPKPPRYLAFAVTPRNAPFQQFLADAAFRPSGDGLVALDAAQFAAAHAADLSLFTLSTRAVGRPAAACDDTRVVGLSTP